ncbi:MAG: response regulator [Chloroflexi bacterium]|nr:response regulator [Chloroflexota bacterium]
MSRILVVDPDASTITWLKALLQREGYLVDSVTLGKTALDALARTPPDLIILERDLPDQDGITLIPALRATRDIPIIILSGRAGSDARIAGLSAGADDYIAKQAGAEVELIAKVRALIAKPRKVAPPPVAPAPPPSTALRRGKIFSFISPKGGTGTTSVCINAASALAKLEPQAEIGLVDMVFPFGSIAQSIGFAPQESISKLTQIAKGHLERAQIERIIFSAPRLGLRVLIGANDPHEAANLEVSQIVPLFEFLQQIFDYVFVDFGRALSRISIPVLEFSDSIVIILTPELNTVRMTRLTLDYLESVGIPTDRLMLINNRTVGRVWISKEESEKELGLPLATTVPFEQEYFTMAINSGVPFFNKFPDHAASLMFTDIARVLRDRASRLVY